MTARPGAPFIVGVPRSGTTLLRLMLDAHPQLAIGPETHFLPELLAMAPDDPRPRSTLARTIMASERWPEFGLTAKQMEAALDAEAPFTVTGGIRAFYRLYAARFGKPRWGDKTPGYVLHMEAIQHQLPEARFIHLVRDGRDVALSVRPLWFGPGTLDEAATWWQERIMAARRQAPALHYYLEVRYEDLVSDLPAHLRRICEFLELDWSPELLRHAARARERLEEINRPLANSGGRATSGEERLEMHQRALGDVDPANVGRWRRDMSAAEIARFEVLAGETLRSLGYPTGAAS